MAAPAARVDGGARRRPGTGIPERVPVGPLAAAAVAAAFFALPLAGLVWRAPWSGAWRELTSAGARQALRLSLVTSVSATAVALVLGLPLAWVQARVTYRGRRLVRALTTLPMVLPPV
ncbi:MAG: molybdate ABC transporter permease subunit, partial [Actinobacteria bacterium]|nr:molybdate ABC transporter permease subunit [Actinomycetota bacterium]